MSLSESRSRGGGSALTTRFGCDGIDWPQLFMLYAEVGLVGGFGKARDHGAIQRAFLASHTVVSVWDGSTLVAAGRVLSDGVCYATIFDVGVLPAYQKQGVGRLLMQALLADLGACSVHLTSTFGNQEFYAKLGFKRHKTAMGKYPKPSEYLE
jgi:ribosomal protein S18 acetylase RimI-like enzyme